MDDVRAVTLPFNMMQLVGCSRLIVPTTSSSKGFSREKLFELLVVGTITFRVIARSIDYSRKAVAACTELAGECWNAGN